MRYLTPVLTTSLSLALLISLDAPSFAHDKHFKGKLDGYQEVLPVSTGASGEFKAKVSKDETSIEYTLSYSGLEGEVRQAHIHFGQAGVNGGIMVWLCQTTFNVDPTGLAPACPQEGSVSGTLTAANVIGPAGQGIAAGEFAEMIEAIRSGAAYANVHSTLWPGGEVRAQLK
jgi:hypothetical protein